MELAQPFIRLPFRFDVERLQLELAQFDDAVWMSHPNRIRGNSAIPLVSLNGEDNDNFAGEMCVTPHLDRCVYIQQVMAHLDEVVARSRLMKLDAGAEVSPHVDFNYHWYHRVRIHIPIVTDPRVTFYCGDQQVHMREGECWIFDSWRLHKVTNEADTDRTHLVIDTAGSSRFWRLVERLAAHQPNPEGDDFEQKIDYLRYQENERVSIKTERFNVAPVMAPGELEAIADELIRDVANNQDNNPALVSEYRGLLRDLAKDWREVYSLHGYQASGTELYRNLLNRTVANLRPNPRALVTSSNNIGINPIIMQRILRAALNAEHTARFFD